MSKIKLEHIDALSKGKKSGIRLGSRAVPHHLYQYERSEYERALRRGYLVVDITDRVNLENLWMLVAKSKNTECLVLHKAQATGVVTSDGNKLFEGKLSEAKAYLKHLVLSK